MTRYFGRLALLFLLTMLAGVSPVWAHHLMGGTTPSTFLEGLLSGLGHPVIGLDHLAFLIALGVAVGISGLNLLMPTLFVGMSAIGVALHLNGVTVPAAEFLVASSLLVVGAMIARAARPALSVWAGLFALAGLLHGYAYGESIFGAESTPLWAYLIGLVVIQTFLAIAIAAAIRTRTAFAVLPAPRLTGAAIAGIGLAVMNQTRSAGKRWQGVVRSPNLGRSPYH
jgi:urease accessory protein